MSKSKQTPDALSKALTTFHQSATYRVETRVIRHDDGSLHVERFSPLRRVEHIVAILVFVALVVTGLPQKFYEASWAAPLIDFLGGLDQARVIHRIAGYLFCGHAIVHVGGLIAGTLLGRLRMTLLPTPQDLRDAWQNLRYYFGYREHPPELPKFDYRQKFEYIGLVLGGMVMMVSGLILIFPVETSMILPGQAIVAARVAHSNEAMLAILVLVVWHLYGSHLSPDVFPMDKSVFTGYMPVEHLQHHHTREYRLIFPDGHEDLRTEDSLDADPDNPGPDQDGAPQPAAE